MTGGPRGLRFGAAYYTEYQPYARLEQDLDLMAGAQFSLIRVGESVWSDWEPREGDFRLDWLEPVLDAAHARGIDVLVGTPTYAIPPWLRTRYPEVAAERSTGRPIAYGHRQDADFTHPTFRRLAHAVSERIVARYADHPAVIGWQVDNEPGIELLHNAGVFSSFRDRLRAEFGDVEALNAAWGLSYWSHRIAEWDELWVPDGNTVPAYDLAWRRHQAELTTDYIAWQVALVRELVPAHHVVTTCLALNRPALDGPGLAEELDLAAVNVYFPMQAALTLPDRPSDADLARPDWLPAAGVADLHRQLDTARGLRGERFWVTETHAQTIGESHVNYPPFPGQWRQAALTMVARGAAAVEYWHWHTLHSGNEAYWGGVLGHDLRPNRAYGELSALGRELRALHEQHGDLEPLSDVTIIADAASGWAMAFQPPYAIPGTTLPDAGSAERAIAAFHTGLFAEGLAADIVPADADLSAERTPVVVVPALYVADDATIDRLVRYAQEGGHLVIGPRFGYADERGIPRHAPMPVRLEALTGIGYQEYTNLTSPVPLAWADGGVAGEGLAWADGLVAPEDAVLARYSAPHLAGFAAVASTPLGLGRVTVVGTLPSSDAARALARGIRTLSLAPDPWAGRPESVTVSHARTADGGVASFVANWSWDAVEVVTPAGATLALGPWDITVEVSR